VAEARRITIIIDHLGAAGTQRQVAMLATELAAAGRDVEIIALEPEAMSASEAPAGVRVTGCPVASLSQAAALPGILRLAGHLRRTRPDVVHTFLLKANVAGAVAARLAGVPVVVGARRSLGYDLTPRGARSLRLVNRWLDGVVGNDRSVIDAAAAREGQRPPCPIVIPNGVMVPTVPALTALRRGRDVGVLANLRPVKGHDVMLEAFAKLREQRPDARLHLMGDRVRDPEWVEILDRQVRELGLSATIVAYDPKTPPAVFFANIDVLAVPSRSEGLPNAVLEAMAHGVAVVATDVGGAAAALGGNGRLVPVGDPSALATALAAELADNDGRRRRGLAGKARTEREFSPAAMARRHLDWYDWLLDTANRGPWGLAWRAPRRGLLIAIDTLDAGGTEQQVMVWTREFQRQGVPVEIACLRSGGRAADRLRADGALVHELGKRTAIDPLFLCRQQALLNRRRPAAVLALLTTAGLWTVPGSRLAGVPRVLFSMRATALTDDPARTGPLRLLSWSLRAAHHVFGNSHAVLDYCRRELRVPDHRLTLLPNAIAAGDLRERTRADVRRELGLPAGEPLVGIIARLVPIKDHELFLDACAQLLARRPRLHAVIAGDGPQEQAIAEGIRQRGLQRAVTMLGHRDDTLAVLRALDVALLTSHSEGSPNAVLEALAVGTPVVSVDVGDVAALLGADGGRVIAGRDAGELARAVLDELSVSPGSLTRPESGREPANIVHELRRYLRPGGNRCATTLLGGAR
jgi:glycosyltransferase involved in cell wall biosynthesis